MRLLIFSKVLDQLIRATMLKINSIIDYLEICLESKRSYLPDNLIMVVSVSLNPHMHEIFLQLYGMKCVPGDPLKEMIN